MKRRWGASSVLGVACALMLTAAKPADPPADVVWTHPNPLRLGITTIAVLPVVVLDGGAQAASLVEKSVPWSWMPTGHAWLQASSSREFLKAPGGEGLLRELTDQVRREGRVDSAAAQRLARVLHMGAFLAVRVDRWERHERDRTQLKAKPSFTAVGLRLALVDSAGTLLWSASGAEVLQEAQRAGEPAAGGPWGMRPGALGMGLRTVSTAPPFEDVLAKLLARWKPLFLGAARRST
ncbi:MAG TPA: hypothetical protein VGK93_07870 [Candidatus Eisenbacteria bacterium]|jgi:hypothetical protein